MKPSAMPPTAPASSPRPALGLLIRVLGLLAVLFIAWPEQPARATDDTAAVAPPARPTAVDAGCQPPPRPRR